MNKLKTVAVMLALCVVCVAFAGDKVFKVTSPNGCLKVALTLGKDIRYSVYDGEAELLSDNRIGLVLSERGSAAENVAVRSWKTRKISEVVEAPFYRKSEFRSECNELSVELKNGTGVIFRVFDSGLAYRFFTHGMKGEYCVSDEIAEFNFTSDCRSWLPYTTNEKNQMAMAFQATYDVAPLSEAKDLLAFLPATFDCGNAKLTILESDLEAYPGMFIKAGTQSVKGQFAKYPKTTDFYPWRQQEYVTSTEDYIAKCSGDRNFPWRVIVVTHNDTEMPVNNLVYALASPNRIGDVSWIKPGKVAWDWWNDWGLSGVDFKAGINTETYKYYIDFAAKNKLEYIILDEGWYNPKSGDMLTVIPEIDFPELVEYGKKKNVGIVLWTVFNVLDKQLNQACARYASMGVKGFKVDFLDRDDQQGVEMIYRIADECAKHHLLLDYHGIFKPTGLNRTYPNVVNYEAVFGMEEAKWSKAEEKDMPLYDVTFPYIRMMAGYVDFTPGGMRNASKKDFQPVYYNPMTMGTRCHQMAMYIVHDSPFTMLADNPVVYEREQRCTDFIASLPTVYDDMIVPSGKMGEYIVTARRQGDNWFVGGQTNWDGRDIKLNFSFLPKGIDFNAVMFYDGINADKAATDYAVRNLKINSDTVLDIHMASGGGFVIKLIK